MMNMMSPGSVSKKELLFVCFIKWKGLEKTETVDNAQSMADDNGKVSRSRTRTGSTSELSGPGRMQR